MLNFKCNPRDRGRLRTSEAARAINMVHVGFLADVCSITLFPSDSDP